MPRFGEPLDLFSSGNPDVQIEHLYRLRRSTYRAIIRFGEAYWAESQRLFGQLYAPPEISGLPASQQPKALAADEASRVAGAYLYGLDEAATTAAVTLGADLSALAPHQADMGASRLVEAVAIKPPSETGILRWASGVGYSGDGIPLIACHWGPINGGTWLSWWADSRVDTRNGMANGSLTREEASNHLRELGPLTFDELATTLFSGAWPQQPTGELPPPQAIAQGLALTATVLASWALLTAPSAARLITRGPTAQASQDRRAGLKPRPATLATGPTSAVLTTILQELADDGPAAS